MKKIMIGSIFIICLFLLLPSVSAADGTIASTTHTSRQHSQILLKKISIDTHIPEYLYIMFTNILITLLVGKPSLSRMFLNYNLLAMTLSEISSGEESENCPNTSLYMVANTFYTFAAFIYHKSQNKAVGAFIGILIYLMTAIIILSMMG